ncbi:MAG: glycosyltransferase family 39 protein [Bacteroidota bacterium]
MTILKNSKEHWLILLILVLGIVFRLLPLNQYQFSHDELSVLSRTFYYSFSDALNYGVTVGDVHPALIQLFVFYWVKVVGYNEIAVKLPFLLCGILNSYIIYRFCKEFFSNKVALIATTVVSLSFIFVLYSSYARMYVTGVLFSLLLLHAVFKILFSDQVSTKHYVLFSLSCVLCAYNHHMNCLFAFSVVLLALYYIPKGRLKWFVISSAAAVLLYLPHLSVTLYQFSIGGLGASAGGWLTAPRNTEIYYFIKALFGCGIGAKLIVAILLLLMVASVLKLRPISKKQTFLFWIFTGNYLVIHLYSVFKSPVLQYSGLLFCGLCLIILLSSFVEFLSKKQVQGITIIFIGLLCFESVYKKQIFTRVHLQDFESQVKTTLDFQKQYGKDNVTSIFKTEDFFVYLYEKKYHTVLNYLSLRDSSILQKPYLLRTYLKNLKQPFIVLGGVGVDDIALVKEYFPFMVFHREDYFRNTLVFSKYDSHYSDASLLKEIPLMNSDINIYINGNKQLSFKDDSMYFEIKKEDDEFPFNLNLPLIKTDFKLGQFVLAEISYSTVQKTNIDKERLCMSVAEKDKDAVFFKTMQLADYYDSTKAIQTAYLEYFVGADNPVWARKQMALNTFIWKEKNTAYTIRRFKLKQYEYNPTKWTLWE